MAQLPETDKELIQQCQRWGCAEGRLQLARRQCSSCTARSRCVRSRHAALALTERQAAPPALLWPRCGGARPAQRVCVVGVPSGGRRQSCAVAATVTGGPANAGRCACLASARRAQTAPRLGLPGAQRPLQLRACPPTPTVLRSVPFPKPPHPSPLHHSYRDYEEKAQLGGQESWEACYRLAWALVHAPEVRQWARTLAIALRSAERANVVLLILSGEHCRLPRTHSLCHALHRTAEEGREAGAGAV